MRYINKVQQVQVRDGRIGDNTKHNAQCETPWGNFRAVACARDHVLANVPSYWNDIRFLDDATIAKRVYSRIYQACQRNAYGFSKRYAQV